MYTLLTANMTVWLADFEEKETAIEQAQTMVRYGIAQISVHPIWSGSPGIPAICTISIGPDSRYAPHQTIFTPAK